MKQSEKVLLEMPEVLFRGFLRYLGISSIKTLLLKYHEKGKSHEIKCLYATLRRTSETESPTLVLLDLRSIGVYKTKLILMRKPPIILKGIVESLDEYGSIGVKELDKKSQETFQIETNTSGLSTITIGDNNSRFTCLYLLDLVKRCDELIFNKDYKWINK